MIMTSDRCHSAAVYICRSPIHRLSTSDTLLKLRVFFRHLLNEIISSVHTRTYLPSLFVGMHRFTSRMDIIYQIDADKLAAVKPARATFSGLDAPVVNSSLSMNPPSATAPRCNTHLAYVSVSSGAKSIFRFSWLSLLSCNRAGVLKERDG